MKIRYTVECKDFSLSVQADTAFIAVRTIMHNGQLEAISDVLVTWEEIDPLYDVKIYRGVRVGKCVISNMNELLYYDVSSTNAY